MNRMVLPLLAITVLTSCGYSIRHASFPLDDAWTFSSADHRISGQASVPGAIHPDLWHAGFIPDPNTDEGTGSLAWVDTVTWDYSRPLPAVENARGNDRWELVFEGLDTQADIWIGDSLVLRADNMFRPWRIPFGPDLYRSGERLRVVFHPVVNQGQALAARIPWTYPADSDPNPGKPSVFIRKAAYQFGWDFAPSMPGCGIWRPVRLERWRGIRGIDGALLVDTVSADRAETEIRLRVDMEQAHHVVIRGRIGTAPVRWTGRLPKGMSEIRIPVSVPSPELWWPHDQGRPALTEVRLHLRAGRWSDSLSWKAGLVSVHLDRERDDRGEAFRFLVNGRPVFMAGANWVPADMFPGTVSAQRTRDLLTAAREAGFNMLRVWGGGIYESDLFYDLADSLGILVWQDFMFANTCYPADSLFLGNVRAEAEDQIFRLRRHPSLALWCGNNEIDVARKHWGWPQTYGWSQEVVDSMDRDYDRLFRDLLPECLDSEDPMRAYIHTSPLSNWGDPADLLGGDNHFWGVWHGEMALDSFRTRIPRFASEYGMPSYPVWETLVRYLPTGSRIPGSSWVESRHRGYKGNGLINAYGKAEGLTWPARDLQAWVAMGQKIQAKGDAMALQAHLQAAPYCMGSLVWQFNEPWPGCSWSLIDYGGRRKPAYDAMKQVLEDWRARKNP